MTVQSGSAGIGQKEIKTSWPVVEGTDFGTTKIVVEPFLDYEQSVVSQKDKVGF